MSELSLKFKIYVNDTEVNVGEVKLNASLVQDEQKELKTYTTKELAKLLNTHEDYINLLRKNGAIVGTKLGNKNVYSSEEIESFLKDYKGYELSNEAEIRNSVSEIYKKRVPLSQKTRTH